MFHGLSNDYLYSAYRIEAVFADPIGNTRTRTGTTFFVRNSAHSLCLVTNRHVLDISYRRHATDDVSQFTLRQLIVTGKARNPANGHPDVAVRLVVRHANVRVATNPDNDIACVVNPPICTAESVHPTIDFFVDLPLLATREDFNQELMVCDFLAFPGYPPWHDRINARPILRTGAIASDPRFDYRYEDEVLGECVAYEAFSFGGSSGSPVFAVQKGPRPGAGIDFPGFRDLKMLGINAGHLRTEERHHSGISYLYKSYAIAELVG